MGVGEGNLQVMDVEMIQYRPAYKKRYFGLSLKTLSSRATARGLCHLKFKHTNEVYAIRKTLGLLSC